MPEQNDNSGKTKSAGRVSRSSFNLVDTSCETELKVPESLE